MQTSCARDSCVSPSRWSVLAAAACVAGVFCCAAAHSREPECDQHALLAIAADACIAAQEHTSVSDGYVDATAELCIDHLMSAGQFGPAQAIRDRIEDPYVRVCVDNRLISALAHQNQPDAALAKLATLEATAIGEADVVGQARLSIVETLSARGELAEAISLLRRESDPARRYIGLLYVSGAAAESGLFDLVEDCVVLAGEDAASLQLAIADAVARGPKWHLAGDYVSRALRSSAEWESEESLYMWTKALSVTAITQGKAAFRELLMKAPSQLRVRLQCQVAAELILHGDTKMGSDIFEQAPIGASAAGNARVVITAFGLSGRLGKAFSLISATKTANEVDNIVEGALVLPLSEHGRYIDALRAARRLQSDEARIRALLQIAQYAHAEDDNAWYGEVVAANEREARIATVSANRAWLFAECSTAWSVMGNGARSIEAAEQGRLNLVTFEDEHDIKPVDDRRWISLDDCRAAVALALARSGNHSGAKDVVWRIEEGGVKSDALLRVLTMSGEIPRAIDSTLSAHDVRERSRMIEIVASEAAMYGYSREFCEVIRVRIDDPLLVCRGYLALLRR